MKKFKPAKNIFTNYNRLPFFLFSFFKLLNLYDFQNKELFDSLKESGLLSKYKKQVLKKHSLYKQLVINWTLCVISFIMLLVIFQVVGHSLSKDLAAYAYLIFVVFVCVWYYFMFRLGSYFLYMFQRKHCYNEYVTLVKAFIKENCKKN